MLRRGTLIVLAALVVLTGLVIESPAQSALERLRSKGVVRMGFANEAPFSFSRPDGSLAGSDYELAKVVFERLGVPKVDGVLVNFGSLIPGLKARRFDVVAAGVYIRPERCQQVAFSEPNLAVGDAVMVPAGNPKKIHSFADIAKDKSFRLGGTLGGLPLKNAQEAGVAKEQLVEFPDLTSALAALKAGRLDGALEPTVTSRWTMKAAGDRSIEVAHPFEQRKVGGRSFLNYTAVAFHLEDMDLRDAFNAQLTALRGTREHQALLDKYGMTSDEVPKGITTAELCRG